MKRPVKISAVIITFNEERNIRRCLESVKTVADEIMVIDSYSTDRTEEICRRMGACLMRHAFEGHIEQKNYAMLQASHERILSLDADEALSEELATSILHAKSDWRCDAYSLNRLTSYCGRWIRHGGWYPDEKVRLWDRRKGSWGGVNPHDKVVMDKNSSVSHLTGDLLHYSYRTIAEQVAQMNSFSDIAARAEYARGRRANLILDILLNPAWTFVKTYIVKLGVLDGYYGLVISLNTAFFKFLKYAKLRDLERDKP